MMRSGGSGQCYFSPVMIYFCFWKAVRSGTDYLNSVRYWDVSKTSINLCEDWLLLTLSKDRCCCCCQVASVVSDSVRPHRRQPIRLPYPWDSPGKNTSKDWGIFICSNALPTPKLNGLNWGRCSFLKKSLWFSKKTGTSVLQPKGTEFCRNHVSLNDALVCQRCHSKIPQTQWLKPQKFIS